MKFITTADNFPKLDNNFVSVNRIHPEEVCSVPCVVKLTDEETGEDVYEIDYLAANDKFEYEKGNFFWVNNGPDKDIKFCEIIEE